MAHIENAIQNFKNKHLSAFERGEITSLHKAGHSNQKIVGTWGAFAGR